MKRIFPIIVFMWFSMNPLFLTGDPPLSCQISVTRGETGICQGQPLVLIAKVDEGLSEVTNHLWETGGTLLSTSDKAFVRFDTNQPGVYQVSYKAWDEAGRQALCKLEIEVAKAPEVQIVENFGFFRRILFKKPVLQLQINSTESHTFQWFLNGKALTGAQDAEFKPSQAGKYHVRVTSPQGCSAFSEEINIE